MSTPVDRPNGFRAIGTLNGANFDAATFLYSVDASNATAIFPGDALTLEADGNVTPAAAGGIVIGHCAGVVIDEDVVATINQGYLPATTAGTVRVLVGPDILFEIQEDGLVSQLAETSRGANVDLIAGAGSTTTGLSAHEIDSSSLTSAGSAQYRIMYRIDHTENDVGNVGTRWAVRLNTGESHIGTTNGI
jgi:hypothetical protein